jgi:hypothetical protein
MNNMKKLILSVFIFTLGFATATHAQQVNTVLKEPFAPGALYEFKIDTSGDAVAELSYSAQLASLGDRKQTATVRRNQGKRAGGVGDKPAARSFLSGERRTYAPCFIRA